MLYAIFGEDEGDSLERRRVARADHLHRLVELRDQGRLVLAGPHPVNHADMAQGMSGSLVVADFASLELAQTWANADPYVAARVYRKVVVKPFLQVLP